MSSNVGVFYLDGSAQPNPGYYGSGVFGYVYNIEDKLVKKNVPKKHIITVDDIFEEEVYNKNKDSFTIVNPRKYVNAYFSHNGVGTNNAAELLAFVHCVTNIVDNITELDLSHVHFKLDSSYVIGVIEKILSDTKRGWDTSDRPNLDILYSIEKAVYELEKNGITFVLEKVVGHSTNLGNNIADRLAYLARHNASLGNTNSSIFKISDGDKYWSAIPDKHPFLDYTNIYFTPEFRQNNNNAYLIMHYKKDDELGKRSYKATYGLVVLANPDEYLNMFINRYITELSTLSILVNIDVSEIYTPYVYNTTNLGVDNTVFYNRKKGELLVAGEIVAGYDIRPPGLANQAIDRLVMYSSILEDYKTNNTNRYTFMDVTDSFFANDGKKTTIKLDSNVKVVNLDIKHNDREYKLPLDLAYDMITRNQLKRLEKQSPKVTLAVYATTPRWHEHYVIIELDNGDMSIWANYYTNGVLFK